MAAANKSFVSLSVSILLILLFFLCIQLSLSHAHVNHHFNDTKPEPFEFLRHLKGCHKGQTVKGLDDLKKYLTRFGYLNYHGKDDNNFDDSLESAVKTYQSYYHLNITGDLDSETVTQMMKPRCSVPDITKGTTSMQSGMQMRKHEHHGGIHTVSHYSFFPGNPKWPKTKTHLTYAFRRRGRRRGVKREILIRVCARAFKTWSQVSHFTFEKIGSFRKADIQIGFYRDDHGDNSPFDGPSGVVAHAYAPPDGRFHYDADTPWSVGPVTNAVDLETVAVHEIGHLLGLHHSTVEDAIMYPTMFLGEQKVKLHQDDIRGIRDLYDL